MVSSGRVNSDASSIKSLLSQYDETGDLVSKLDVNISVPIMD